MINTNEILKKYNIRLSKQLSQNFLTDINIIRKIVDAAEINGDDFVIEIGPGIGALTVALAGKAGKVAAIEIDSRIIPALEETTGSFKNVTIINEDILKTDIQSLTAGWDKTVKIVSNLPYYITTPVIMMFLENDFPVERMVFMVQKEVAERMSAKPGSKDYGALSVGVQTAGDIKLLFNVSRRCFIPKPEVDSVVIKITPSGKYLDSIVDKKVFFQCVRAAFSKRRKTLLNAINSSDELKLEKETIRDILASLNLNCNVRGEELSIEQFIAFANIVANLPGHTVTNK
ncbi:MAG: 16S rRNA (adenine(1518)-N(6)/adenine(1519)-N(6))-dimethyltransferase RsmA [Clostridiaceae bacterium]|nr:16S rRNA (adenine(1518)-N(6)/adenine(1519)-N(6))-dimethyltransferase RsmA [Clostridiaceae bacterium]